MVFLTVWELIDICIAVVATGYIYMDLMHIPGKEAETFGNRLLLSIAIAAPAVVFHEFGHKLVAMALGYNATFHAAYMWLGLGIVLKLISFPLLFFVPAYVSIAGVTGPEHALIAFAGPAINGVLWIGAWIALKAGNWGRTTEAVLYYTRTINMFLFIFNLIPIPGFDGWALFSNLF
jgi:Zn-dependent protease